MNKKILKRIQRRDRIARYVITVGGMAVIFSVLLILFLIARVTVPLFQPAVAERVARFPVADQGATVMAAGLDEYRESPFVVDAGGRVRFFAPGGQPAGGELLLAPPAGASRILAVDSGEELTFGALWDNGSMTLDQVRFPSGFDAEGRRVQSREVARLASLPPLEQGVPKQALMRRDGEERLTQVCLLDDNRLLIRQMVTETDLFGDSREATHLLEATGLPGEPITALVLDTTGKNLYAGTGRGTLLHWDLSEAGAVELLDRLPAFPDGRAITSLALIFGDISLAVGDDRGGVATWFGVRDGEGVKRLQRIHVLSGHRRAVAGMIPSRRDKSLISFDAAGQLHMDHMTSERHLLTLSSEAPLRAGSLAPRGDGLFAVDAAGTGYLWKLRNPHPEVSWRTLFGKVWYENYDQPRYVWQSSAATEDFEPKKSLTPLIFGTLKGTFYAMLFAVPLALLGAIYTSQFGNARLRGMIKPTVEVMAAIPSVVIGFLAALWFAPLLERSVPALFLGLLLVPVFLLAAMVLWQGVRNRPLGKQLDRGVEFLLLMPVLVLAVATAITLGPMVENWLFDGNFKLWLFHEAGVRYDSRNCIVIAFALGFAVIPIIYTIAEDALSNVPQSLKAASLALGASRWQTVWRVILPSASPGIFAGTMIGFGRAIGETMIVLMATGNTPIMDWSIFNGMRPLSANIAVEIPEAPVGGTLYRILFLSAVILFTMTFILNTAAELVRQRLRKKYGRF